MKRIIIVDCPESAKDLPVTMVVFSDENRYLRADGSKIKEFISPTNEEICKMAIKTIPGARSVSKALQGSFIIGANWFRSLLTCILIALILTSCAVYPEPEPVEWKPKHTGTYVECDAIVNGDTLYYFKKL